MLACYDVKALNDLAVEHKAVGRLPRLIDSAVPQKLDKILHGSGIVRELACLGVLRELRVTDPIGYCYEEFSEDFI